MSSACTPPPRSLSPPSTFTTGYHAAALLLTTGKHLRNVTSPFYSPTFMMSFEQPVILSDTQITSEQSAAGTLIEQGSDLSKLAVDNSFGSQVDSESELNESDSEEQALESHEVIELQTFSERKAWIEEKIEVSTDPFHLNNSFSFCSYIA